jgi:hypothetical protein
MVWTNPETLTPEEIQAELAQVELKLTEARKSGGKILELETHKWRLQFEQRSLMNNPADEISQALRRQIIANDRKVAEERRLSTYLDHAQSSIDDERGGRFAAVSPTRTVVGAAPISYPRQPEGSPWACDPVPQEPPLGYSVNDQECVGEAFERDGTPPSPAAVERGLVAPPVGDRGRAAKSWRRL